MDAKNDSSSSSGIDCGICYCKIKDESPYAILKSKSEPPYKYHPECAEGWIDVSDRGILSDDFITSYEIYQDGYLVEEVINGIGNIKINLNGGGAIGGNDGNGGGNGGNVGGSNDGIDGDYYDINEAMYNGGLVPLKVFAIGYMLICAGIVVAVTNL